MPGRRDRDRWRPRRDPPPSPTCWKRGTGATTWAPGAPGGGSWSARSPPAERHDAGPLFAEGFDPADPWPPCGPGARGRRPRRRPRRARCRPRRQGPGLRPGSPSTPARRGAVGHAGRRAGARPRWRRGRGMMNVLSPWARWRRCRWSPCRPARWPPGRERTGLAPGGYQCDYGVSFVMAVELTDDGPDAVGLLAYGQTGDARRPSTAPAPTPSRPSRSAPPVRRRRHRRRPWPTPSSCRAPVGHLVASGRGHPGGRHAPGRQDRRRGVVGCAIAHELSRYRLRVTLVERAGGRLRHEQGQQRDHPRRPPREPRHAEGPPSSGRATSLGRPVRRARLQLRRVGG